MGNVNGSSSPSESIHYRKQLGLNLRYFRKSQKIPAKKIAETLGMSESNYYKLEGEDPQNIKSEWLPIIAHELNVTIEDLYSSVPVSKKRASDEQELLRIFREYSEQDQIQILQLIKDIKFRSLNKLQIQAIHMLVKSMQSSASEK